MALRRGSPTVITTAMRTTTTLRIPGLGFARSILEGDIVVAYPVTYREKERLSLLNRLNNKHDATSYDCCSYKREIFFIL